MLSGHRQTPESRLLKKIFLLQDFLRRPTCHLSLFDNVIGANGVLVSVVDPSQNAMLLMLTKTEEFLCLEWNRDDKCWPEYQLGRVCDLPVRQNDAFQPVGFPVTSSHVGILAHLYPLVTKTGDPDLYLPSGFVVVDGENIQRRFLSCSEIKMVFENSLVSARPYTMDLTGIPMNDAVASELAMKIASIQQARTIKPVSFLVDDLLARKIQGLVEKAAGCDQEQKVASDNVVSGDHSDLVLENRALRARVRRLSLEIEKFGGCEMDPLPGDVAGRQFGQAAGRLDVPQLPDEETISNLSSLPPDEDDVCHAENAKPLSPAGRQALLLDGEPVMADEPAQPSSGLAAMPQPSPVSSVAAQQFAPAAGSVYSQESGLTHFSKVTHVTDISVESKNSDGDSWGMIVTKTRNFT